MLCSFSYVTFHHILSLSCLTLLISKFKTRPSCPLLCEACSTGSSALHKTQQTSYHRGSCQSASRGPLSALVKRSGRVLDLPFRLYLLSKLDTEFAFPSDEVGFHNEHDHRAMAMILLAPILDSTLAFQQFNSPHPPPTQRAMIESLTDQTCVESFCTLA